MRDCVPAGAPLPQHRARWRRKYISDVKQFTLKTRKIGYRGASLVMGDIDAIIGGASRTEPRH
jgi:hypothetical protein